MFILGICSLFQVAFLPGFILLRPFKITGVLKIMVYSFALSLIANYFAVLILTTLGLYTRSIVLSIFIIELFVFLKICHPMLNQPVLDYSITNKIQSFLKDILPESKLLKLGALFLALFMTLLYLKLFFTNTGQVFSQWDDVVSWNRWAVAWYGNVIPRDTMLYPQLLPINISLTYMFIGSPVVQFFAKAIMPLFSLFILMLVWDMAIDQKRIGSLVSIFAIGLIFRRLLGKDLIISGYADVPVSFFIFLAICMILVSRDENDTSVIYRRLALGALFAAGAAVTKQAGLIIAFLYPVLSYFVILRSLGANSKISTKTLLVSMIIVILIIVAPWFIYKELSVMRGQDFHEFNAIKHMSSPAQAVHLIREKAHPIYLFLFVFIPMIFALTDRAYRWVFVLFVLPITSFWIVFLGYDLRNLTPVMPLIGLSIGIGADAIIAFVKNNSPAATRTRGNNTLSNLPEEPIIRNAADPIHDQDQRLLNIKRYHFVLILAAITAVLSLKYTDAHLLDRQVFLQKRIGDLRLNTMLYEYQRANGFSGKILTHYQILGHLPGLDKFYQLCHFHDYADFNRLRNDPNVHFLLIGTLPGWGIDQKVYDDIEENIRSGKYHVVSRENATLFVQIRKV